MNLIKYIAALSLLTATTAFADFYQASLQQAHWQFKNENNSCSLKQLIPDYGSAEFLQKPREPLLFHIQEQRHKPYIIKASLKLMPAPWRHETLATSDFPVYRDIAGKGRYEGLSVHGDAAESMLDGLLQGHYPTFVYVRDGAPLLLQETQVAVSSVKFAENYAKFSECRIALPMQNVHHKLIRRGKNKRDG
jgi:hypothetical protein